jgi:hypothetical protein
MSWSAFVSDWVQAQLTGTFSEYQAFYAPSYPPDGREWANWDALRGSEDPSLEPLEIQISDLGIFAHQDTRVVVMQFVLVLGEQIRDLGRRKLFVRQDATGRPLWRFPVDNASKHFWRCQKGSDRCEDPLTVPSVMTNISDPYGCDSFKTTRGHEGRASCCVVD